MPRLITPLSVLAVAGASIAIAACGSSSGGDSASGAGASAGQGQTSTNQSAAFKKFQDCLKDNGVTLPDRGQRPGGGQGYGDGPPAGSDGTPPTATNGTPPAGSDGQPPTGTPPAGGGFADNPKFQAAMKACAKFRPQGLRDGRGGPD